MTDVTTTRKETTELRLPVGIWIRVSTEMSARSDSPKHHEIRGRAYAELKGWRVVRIYDLSAVSGRSVVNHPECQAMLDDVVTGRIKALIFSTIPRLARNTKELLDFADHFEAHDAHLVALDEAIDTSTHHGRLFFTWKGALGEFDRKQTAERIKASVKVRAELGKHMGGEAQYGYRWEDQELLIDEKEAAIRKELFEIYLETRRFKATAKRLNDAGYRTRKGKLFSDSTVRRHLTDPIAKGLRCVNRTTRSKDGKRFVLKPESEWVYHPAPSIVSEEVWEACNDIIRKQQRSRKKPARQPVQLFGDVLECHCGTRMYKRSNSPKYVCRTCRNKIPVLDIETIFVEQLKGFYFDDDEIAEQMNASSQEIIDREELMTATQQQMADLERRMEKTYQLYLDDVMKSEDFADLYNPLKKQHRELSNTLPQLQGELDALSIAQNSVSVAVEDNRWLYANWNNLDFQARRTVIETIVEKIIIHENEVEIVLAYVPYQRGVPLEIAA